MVHTRSGRSTAPGTGVASPFSSRGLHATAEGNMTLDDLPDDCLRMILSRVECKGFGEVRKAATTPLVENAIHPLIHPFPLPPHPRSPPQLIAPLQPFRVYNSLAERSNANPNDPALVHNRGHLTCVMVSALMLPYLKKRKGFLTACNKKKGS
jgi:hypothetical protein